MKKIIEVAFPFLPIISQYKIYGSINYGIILVCFLFAISILIDRKIKINKALLAIYLLIVAIDLVKIIYEPSIFSGSKVNLLLLYLFYVFSISLYSSINSINRVINIYTFLAILSTAVLFYQVAVIEFFNIPVRPLSFLPIAESDQRLWMQSFRPSSFFTEPQTYATYVLIPFAISLLKGNKIISLYLGLGILLSTSTFGLFSMLLVILLTYSLAEKNQQSKRNLTLTITTFSIAFFIGLYFGFFDSAIDKILRTDFSTQIRVSKGFLIIVEMPWHLYFFGMIYSLTDFLMANIGKFPFLFPYVGSEAEHLLGYVSTLYSLPIKYGFFIGLFYIVILALLFKNSVTKTSKLIVLIMILLTISSTFFLNAWFMFYFTFLCAYEYNNSCEQRGVFRNFVIKL